MYFFMWDCFLLLLFAFWWTRLRDLCKLPDGGMRDGKNSGGQNLAQESFSPIICCWVGLHPLPDSCLAWGSSALGATVELTGELQEGLCQGGPSWPNAASVPVPVVSPCWPTLHRRPSNTSREFQFSLLWGHCSSPLGLGVGKILFVSSKTGVCFPQSCGSPIIKCHWPSRSDSLEIVAPLSNPQAEKCDLGFRTFTALQEHLWYYCSPVCGSPTPQV